MTIKEEMTTPVAPVGAGAEQSSQNQSTSIIPEINEDFNTPDDFFQQNYTCGDGVGCVKAEQLLKCQE